MPQQASPIRLVVFGCRRTLQRLFVLTAFDLQVAVPVEFLSYGMFRAENGARAE
jgi:hypothetical protein